MNIFSTSGEYCNTKHTQANHQLKADELEIYAFLKRKFRKAKSTHQRDNISGSPKVTAIKDNSFCSKMLEISKLLPSYGYENFFS